MFHLTTHSTHYGVRHMVKDHSDSERKLAGVDLCQGTLRGRIDGWRDTLLDRDNGLDRQTMDEWNERKKEIVNNLWNEENVLFIDTLNAFYSLHQTYG